MRSVLGALGYSARKSRPDLSGPVSILQCRFNRVQGVRHTRNQQGGETGQRLTQISHCLFARFQWIRSVLCLTGMPAVGVTRAEQAQAGYVIMFADMSLLAGLPAPVTLVSWRSHHVKRVMASASAAEAMGLSEAIAQGDWVRALWSEMVLGLSLREWRERKDVPPLISVTDSKGNYDHLHNETIGPSEDRKSAMDLAIIREESFQTTDVLAVG